MLEPTPSGMLVRLPVIDTDPNRGVTAGVMPTWVVREKGGSAVRHIHAPSVTYNDIFRLTGTYRYFHYPRPDTNLLVRLSGSGHLNREAVAEYRTHSFLDRELRLYGRFDYSIDSSNRFFGIGPDTPESGESNYTLNTLKYRFHFGVPLRTGSPLFANLGQKFEASEVQDGGIDTLPSIGALYPEHGPTERHQDSAWRLFLSYDTRDSHVTTTRGTYAELFGETSRRGFLSEYNYHRYGADLRRFLGFGEQSRLVTAARARFEHLTGSAPFWSLPQMGGKYLHRGYGTGRYTDRGLLVLGLEERVRLYSTKISGVRAEFGLDPFVELGTVFREPGKMEARHFRPAAGFAVRALARPQVVGSLDFAFGREGLKIFVDINYSY